MRFHVPEHFFTFAWTKAHQCLRPKGEKKPLNNVKSRLNKHKHPPIRTGVCVKMQLMSYILPFEKLSAKDTGKAGGKGASLGEMTQADIPVPPGFVLLSSAFGQFLKEMDINVEIDSLLHKVDTDAVHTVENASEQIQSLIKQAKMPNDIAKEIKKGFADLGAEFVAVRSSATAEDSASAAWAGQLDSYLNVAEVDLLERVQDCWASLFTPRAIFYRFEKELHTETIHVAVVVQSIQPM